MRDGWLRRRFGGVVLALSLLLPGSLAAPAPAFAETTGGDAAFVAAMERELGLRRTAAAGDPLTTQVARSYASRGYAPLWTDDDGGLNRTRHVLDVLQAADDEGLSPATYDVARIGQLMDDGRPAARAELEWAVSRAYVRYAGDVYAGRINPRTLDNEHHHRPRRVSPRTLLEAAASDPNPAGLLRTLPPRSPDYTALRTLLADLRAEAARGVRWVSVPPGETLKPGMQDARVIALRARLTQSGDYDASLPPPDGAETYDLLLAAAVKRFQAHHGLLVDGVVGAGTLAALNRPISARIDQVMANMERLRWMPRDLGARHISVNLAAYRLELVEDGTVVHTAPVVVGDLDNRTPVFSKLMQYLEFNPYWNVPHSIATEELLPEIQADPGYLQAHNYKVLSGNQVVNASAIDWSAMSQGHFPYRLRQEPGDDNALGRVKFMFPNDHAIYLHDTPSKSLFGRSQRAFSHGCIRVHDPFALAEALLRRQGYDRARLNSIVASDKRTVVHLHEPIPVHLTYITTFVDEVGQPHFLEDIYGRDAALSRALAGRRS